MAAAQAAPWWLDPAPPRPVLPSLPLSLPRCLGPVAGVAVAPAPPPSLHSPSPPADPLLSYIDKDDLELSWTDWGLLGLDLSAAYWSSARRRTLGFSDPIWVVLQRRGTHGSAAGVPAVGQCALRVCAGANCGTFARFGRGLAGGRVPYSWAPSRLLLRKAQRSLVTATASTSATSWVIACCWSAGARLPSHGRVQQWLRVVWW
ncbi:hypothetical protein BDA96_01G427800 [Sorghum bicolor]|uniref:Uncharacterized protein n=1 Tax=Sorghum bicolor TaxID=4558 RepID=A0A921S3M7_SORBI|nr:hypothetical protein BDA96_01G427800 [Sorghum bicolor]